MESQAAELPSSVAVCGRPSRAEQMMEVGAFLLLIVPSMIISLFAIRQGSLSFTLTAVSTIFRDLALVTLVLFFLRRNGESIFDVGWRFRYPGREILIGFFLYFPFIVVISYVEQVLNVLGLKEPATPTPSSLAAAGMSQYILGTVLVVVVAISEETIFRGYLNLRFKNITGSWGVAILFSTIIFAGGHGYEGTIGVLTVGVMGAIFSFVYLWRGNLLAPITMHFMQDFLGIVLVPFFVQHGS